MEPTFDWMQKSGWDHGIGRVPHWNVFYVPKDHAVAYIIRVNWNAIVGRHKREEDVIINGEFFKLSGRAYNMGLAYAYWLTTRWCRAQRRLRQALQSKRLDREKKLVFLMGIQALTDDLKCMILRA